MELIPRIIALECVCGKKPTGIYIGENVYPQLTDELFQLVNTIQNEVTHLDGPFMIMGIPVYIIPNAPDHFSVGFDISEVEK